MAREKHTQTTEVGAGLRGLAAAMEQLDEVAARIYGLNRTDMRALEIVSRLGALTPTELARKLGFTTGGVTTVIDRLENAGYVRRQKDRSDRRRLMVEVTDLTRQRDLAVFGGMGRLTSDLVKGISSAHLVAIIRFLNQAAEQTTAYSLRLAQVTLEEIDGIEAT
jgi:DNA-binding MarR family transcriptional regulator